jgi:hypothetical protein
MKGNRLPSPAFVLALVALMVSLSGTAVAAGVVPLAKRALLADDARKVGGRSAEAIADAAARTPGPASSAAGLVTVKATTWSVSPDSDNDVVVMCDTGQKVVGGGYDDPNGWAHAWDSRPTGDGAGWRIAISVGKPAPSPQTGTAYAICLR